MLTPKHHSRNKMNSNLQHITLSRCAKTGPTQQGAQDVHRKEHVLYLQIEKKEWSCLTAQDLHRTKHVLYLQIENQEWACITS